MCCQVINRNYYTLKHNNLRPYFDIHCKNMKYNLEVHEFAFSKAHKYTVLFVYSRFIKNGQLWSPVVTSCQPWSIVVNFLGTVVKGVVSKTVVQKKFTQLSYNLIILYKCIVLVDLHSCSFDRNFCIRKSNTVEYRKLHTMYFSFFVWYWTIGKICAK